MESPAQGRPNRETGLPPGVEVGPLGKRFVAYLINMSVPVVVSLALIFLLPTTTGALRLTMEPRMTLQEKIRRTNHRFVKRFMLPAMFSQEEKNTKNFLLTRLRR